ncbi:MAG: CDP-diacylglycerol--glycerol-3-phosphate 3-phosphatidyltransferase [Deltaproteobacteria bacterium]|nr:CDP-diacylglycerol--glycerol-3-phosphate 3-phosphatidyltransferase [Deltaproteobacteria bacterium]
MPHTPQSKLWNIPNALSVFRIGTAPILVGLLLRPDEILSIVSALLFLFICLTDWLDGYLARRMNIVTALGKLLDPLADKLLVLTALIMLIPLGRAPAWMVALIVGREIGVTGLRAIASDMGIVIAAAPLGKAKTVAQIIAIFALLLHYSYFGIDFHALGTVVLWIAFGLTIWSGVDYFVKFFRSPVSGGTGSSKEAP